jgi:hypothetical protein
LIFGPAERSLGYGQPQTNTADRHHRTASPRRAALVLGAL